MVYRGPNMDVRHDSTCLLQLPSAEGMPPIPVEVFPQTLKELKTLDDDCANVCLTSYNLNGPDNANLHLDVETKRKLIAAYIGPIPLDRCLD